MTKPLPYTPLMLALLAVGTITLHAQTPDTADSIFAVVSSEMRSYELPYEITEGSIVGLPGRHLDSSEVALLFDAVPMRGSYFAWGRITLGDSLVLVILKHEGTAARYQDYYLLATFAPNGNRLAGIDAGSFLNDAHTEATAEITIDTAQIITIRQTEARKLPDASVIVPSTTIRRFHIDAHGAFVALAPP